MPPFAAAIILIVLLSLVPAAQLRDHADLLVAAAVELEHFPQEFTVPFGFKLLIFPGEDNVTV